jgi:hypothetical protein
LLLLSSLEVLPWGLVGGVMVWGVESAIVDLCLSAFMVYEYGLWSTCQVFRGLLVIGQ